LGLAFFLAYANKLMQINQLLCILHELVKVAYEKSSYENTIFVGDNLRINMKAYLSA